MADFLSEQIIINTSKKYENIYFYLKDHLNIKYQDLFILCAAIGYKNNRLSSVAEKGREFRSNYLTTAQKTTAYSIILNDPEIGKNIEGFEHSEFKIKARKKLEEYAEGGMEILCEEVFRYRFDGKNLDTSYDEYEVDILSYIYREANEIPF